MHMNDFTEQLRKLYEMSYLAEGYGEVKALVVDKDADCKNNPEMKACLDEGYRFIDENLFGQGQECQGKVVVFIKE